MAAAEPTPARQLVCALLVALVAVAVWSVIHWRTAPPPPPDVKMPELPAAP